MTGTSIITRYKTVQKITMGNLEKKSTAKLGDFIFILKFMIKNCNHSFFSFLLIW